MLNWFLYVVWNKGPISFFCVWISSFPPSFIKETILSLLHVLSTFVKGQLSVDAWIYFWPLHSFPLFFMSVFMLVPYNFDDYSFVMYFETRKCNASSFLLFPQGCFGYSGSFVVPYEFLDYFFYFCKKCHWYFDRDCIYSLIA